MRTYTLAISIFIVSITLGNSQMLICPQNQVVRCENFEVETPEVIDGQGLELVERREFENGNSCEEDQVNITYLLLDQEEEIVASCNYTIRVLPFNAIPRFPRDTIVSGFHVDEIFNEPLFTDGLLPVATNDCNVRYTFVDEFVTLFPNAFVFRNWSALNECNNLITISKQDIRLTNIPNMGLSTSIRDCQNQQIFPEQVTVLLNGIAVDPLECQSPFDSLHTILNCLADSLMLEDTDVISIEIPQLATPLLGINLFDIIDMRRHILGISRFQDPCQLEAADVNIDGRINGIDLIELTRLLLGIYIEWPEGEAATFNINGEERSSLELTANDFPLTSLNIIVTNRGNVSAR